MLPNLKRVVIGVMAITLLITGSVFASLTDPSPGVSADDHFPIYLSEQASTLLAQIQKEAEGLRPHADTLDTLSWAPSYSWQTHAEYLHRVKGHINAVGEHIAELQRIRDRVVPWKQQAITELTSHAAQVAASTQAAIVYLRENQDRFFVPEYRDHLTTIADRAGELKQTVDKFLDYEEAQQRLNRLKGESEIKGT